MTHLSVDYTAAGKRVQFKMLYDSMIAQERTLAACLAADRTCEPELSQLLCRVLRPGDVAVDVGAAVGFFTVMMATLVGPTGAVYAFEPDSRNLERLHKNIALNELNNVKVIEQPVSSHAGKVQFFLAKDTGDNSLGGVDVLTSLQDMQATTLDSFPQLDTARFIKVDAEGAEHAIMRGADTLLGAQVPYISMEINERALQRMNTTRQALRQHMAGYNYASWLMDRGGGIPMHIPDGTELTGGANNINLLFATPAAIAIGWPEIRLG